MTHRPAEARAFAPVDVVATAKVPQKKRVPQTTAKRANQREKTLPQKSQLATFAVADDLQDDDDFDPFAVVDSNDWRIERRYYTRQDGAKMMYWNYRRRKIGKTKDGRQRVEYRKGGKKTL